MDSKECRRWSKFLSFVLRHDPASVGLDLDTSGWADVSELLAACSRNGRTLTRDQLREVVQTSNKQRFAFNDDGTRIRASQGHSIEVDLGYESATPPHLLFHGTGVSLVEAIRRDGLLKMSRHQVHLSADRETATQVGQRKGKPVILEIRAEDMANDGHTFHRSDNGVWLVEHVPVDYISFPD